MEQIKFRAWDKVNKVMENDIHLLDELATILWKEKYIVMQFTGMKDKHGQEIYAGDIVTVSYGKGKVVFNSAMFMIEWIDDKQANMESLAFYNYRFGRLRTDLEVIGNIYEQ